MIEIALNDHPVTIKQATQMRNSKKNLTGNKQLRNFA